MLPYERHIVKANQHIAFLEYVARHGNSDYGWICTACFYAAVHVVNARITMAGLPCPTTHLNREILIGPQSPSINAIAMKGPYMTRYQDLKSTSEAARYSCEETEEGNEIVRTKYKDTVRSVKNLDAIIEWFLESSGLEKSPFVPCSILVPKLPAGASLLKHVSFVDQ